MGEKSLEIKKTENWKPKTLMVGAILGVCVGIAAAYIFIQNVEDDGPPSLSSGEGVKLGVLVFGLLRSIATLGEGK